MKINIEQNIYRPLYKNMPLSDVVTGALIDAGSSLVGGIAGMFGQSDANKRNYEQQLALLQNQQQFTNQMWEKQTRENRQSIVNQMSQYRQLGINPLAVTGGVQQSNQTAPSAPSAPQSQYRNPMEGAQIAVLMSEAMKNVAEAKRTEGELPKQEADTAYTWSLQKTEESLRNKRIEAAGVDIELGLSKVRLSQKQVEVLDQQIQNMIVDKKRVESATQNEKLLAYDDYLRSVDLWLNHRAEERHWSTQEKQEWQNLAIRNYEAQVQWKNVQSLIEQRRHMNELTDSQRKLVEEQIEKTRKECEKLGLEIDFDRGTLQYRISSQNQAYVVEMLQDRETELNTRINIKWLRAHEHTQYDLHYLEQILGPINGVLQTIGIGYGLGKMSGRTTVVSPSVPVSHPTVPAFPPAPMN